jgi:hypothetical protein
MSKVKAVAISVVPSTQESWETVYVLYEDGTVFYGRRDGQPWKWNELPVIEQWEALK